MVKYKNKRTLIVTKKIKDSTIVCNMCGLEIGRNRFGYIDEHVEIEKKWGYHSDFDGQIHILHICSECYKKMLASLKIMPQ